MANSVTMIRDHYYWTGITHVLAHYDLLIQPACTATA